MDLAYRLGLGCYILSALVRAILSSIVRVVGAELDALNHLHLSHA